MTIQAPYASAADVIARAMRAWRPPPRLSLSEWSDEYFVLSAETAAEPGRWKSLPYQRGILDSMTDRAVTQVTVMKSARVGYTLMVTAAIAYHMHQDPCSILVVQPTVDDAKEFSKETIAPMLRDVPVLANIVVRDLEEKGPKNSSATLTHKAFPGGILSLIGANSGAGFRRKTRRVVVFDEVDAYPPSAGSEGDPIRLGVMRTQTFWNRKIFAGSTPLFAGSSRIAEMFEAGDQRRYYVPCPHCNHMDFLTFREQASGVEPRGHFMRWDEGKPETACFVCRSCGCFIEHKDKRWMVERGEWRAEKPFAGHASFHIWSAYSYSPNTSWGDIAAEFLEANKGGPEKLKTFINTWLGETWVEKGEAPDWQRLYERARVHPYQRGTVPAGVLFLTAGVDVQHDRLVYEVVGWGADRQSWSIEAGIIPGDTAKEETWRKLDEFLAQTWPGDDGLQLPIRVLGIDSGDQTQTVYSWARKYPGRVLACKGSATAKTLLGSPTPVDVKLNGKRIARGCKVWPVGVDIAKSEFYGWLRLDAPKDGEPFPSGWCHHPEYGEDYFKQITAEHLVKVRTKKGYFRHDWCVIPGRENHYLDARVYARAVTVICRLDQIAAQRARQAAPPAAPSGQPSSAPPPAGPAPTKREAAAAPAVRPERKGWLRGGRGGKVEGGSWLSRRR